MLKCFVVFFQKTVLVISIIVGHHYHWIILYFTALTIMGGKSSKMGHVMGKLSDFLHVDCRFPISGERESRILMLGLDAAGRSIRKLSLFDSLKSQRLHFPCIKIIAE